MPRRRLAAVAVAAVVIAGSIRAQTPQLAGVRDLAAQASEQLGGQGAGLVVLRGGQVVHGSVHGKLASDTVLPIASASKWLAVATILTLVDEGKLDLDAPVARYVKEFDRADRDRITLRQCLANTSGLPPRLAERRAGGDVDGFAAAAAEAGARAQPDAAFRYGGVGFEVAAVAAVRVAGCSWHELFAARLAAPLGMKDTRFGALFPVAAEPGTAALPWVAGGAVSTLDDYARFLRMLVGRGELDGRRVLSEASVAAMFRDQVPAHVDVQSAGFEAAKVRYGLGTWIVELDGGGVRVCDPGAFGFTPWIDLDVGVAGVFAVKSRVQRVLPQLRRIQDEVRAAVGAPAAAEVQTIALEHGGLDRRYHLHVPPRAPGGAGMPLLVVLHGGGGNGEQAREATGLAEAGVRAGFVVAFPDGTGALRNRLLTWNSGGIDVYAGEHDVDDVGFVRAVVADVMKRAAIDATRVFAVGHSNGGMMCHRLAREAADVFCGVAVVAGAMNSTDRDARSPIAVLIVHGTADEHVRFDGGRPKAAIGRAGDRSDASVQDAVDYYVARNGLVGDPETATDGRVRTTTWANGAHGAAALPVRVIALEGGGHAWPGSGERTRRAADAPFPFDAAAAIVAFCRDVVPVRPAAAEAPKR